MSVPDPASRPSYTLAQYEALLGVAVALGWRFVSFADLSAAGSVAGRLCALRHDCDNDLVAAARMAEIEQAMGVRSTYFVMTRSAQYNLFAPTSRRLVMEILGRGHWLGLHFDGTDYAEAPLRQIARAIDRERRWVSKEFGLEVGVFSLHQPIPWLLGKQLATPAINAYSGRLFRDIFYRSDSNLRFVRDGLPTDVLGDPAASRLQLLVHPEWWTEEVMSADAKWRRMLENNFGLMEQALAEREAAYADRHQLRVVRRDQSEESES